MFNFGTFITKTHKYSSDKFINHNKKVLKILNKIKFTKCSFKKEKMIFKNKDYQKLYDSSPGLPTIQTILNNPKKNYIILGGIRSAGARYPDIIINKKDILYLKKVMEYYGIIQMPMVNINDVIEKCIVLVQEKMNTDLINNRKTKREQSSLFLDFMLNSFRNMCLNVKNYKQLKGDFIGTNLSMLLFFPGDCRELSIFLLYLVRIYLHYNDSNNTYLVMPIYTSFGYKTNKFVKEMEHAFPILINKKTQDIITIDALEHQTKALKNPKVEIMDWKQISIVKIGSKKYYSSGYYLWPRTWGACYFFPLKWYKKVPCEYTDSKYFKNTIYAYGIPFRRPDINLVFNKKFNETIINNLYNSKFCRPKLTIRKTRRKRKRKTRRKTRRKRYII